MPGFKCPFCNKFMSISHDTYRKWEQNFDQVAHSINGPSIRIDIYKCPNCEKETITATGKVGYCENGFFNIYPRSIHAHFPKYVPEAIRQDYEEASLIADLSPKASATLARRCLQGMIRDFWDICEKNLNAEITALKGKVSTAQWNAIDATRKIGNIGAHMENDINLIVDVEPDEAKKLLALIELLVDKWYVARHDEEQLCASISEIGEEKENARKP